MINKTKVVIFDLDGVLADFDQAFTRLGHYLFDTPISYTVSQPYWNFRNVMTVEQQTKVWDIIKGTAGWWVSVPSLVNADVFVRINGLTHRHEVYFVTHRMHSITPAGEQSVQWLKYRGIDNPRVIVSSRKGEIARAVSADYALEDNWGNACSIHWMAEKCRTFLIERPYNEEARKIIPPRISVVKTVDEYLHIVEGGARG